MVLEPLSRRDQIVAAGAALFSEKGYHGASMQDIGQRVGLLKGSLYAHIANKEEVLLEILSTAARYFGAALEAVLRTTDTPPQKLRQAMRAHLCTAQKLGPLAQVYLREAQHLDGEPALWVREARDRYHLLWRRIVDEGIADGSFRRDLDASLAASLALATVQWAQQQNTSGQPATALALADRLCTLLLEGYC